MIMKLKSASLILTSDLNSLMRLVRTQQKNKDTLETWVKPPFDDC